MIRHAVYCRLRADVSEAEVAGVMRALGDLRDAIEGMTGFEWGPNRDFEGKSAGFDIGFVCTFADTEDHARYLGHPDHKAAGARLVALCEGGADGIMVFDLEV